MKITLFTCLFILLSEILQAQTSFRDSIQNIFKAKFTRIIKAKAQTDSSYEAFAFSKKNHELLVATSYLFQKGNSQIYNFVHYYFSDKKLLWFSVSIRYPAKKGYVEYYYSDRTLVEKVTKGIVIHDYSFLREQADLILTKASQVLQRKLHK